MKNQQNFQKKISQTISDKMV